MIQVTLATKLKRQNEFPQNALIGSDAEDMGNGGLAILTAMAATFDQGIRAAVVPADGTILTGDAFAQLVPAIRAKRLGVVVQFARAGRTKTGA